MSYENPVHVGIIPVRRNNLIKLAGLTRGKASDDGFRQLALLSGFVDKGETIEQAIAREGDEELNFLSSPDDWGLLYSSHIPEKNINLVFCLYQRILDVDILAGKPLSAEVLDYQYIDESSKLAFEKHEEAVKRFYAKYAKQFFGPQRAR
jgi:ADP-ribose pyrophosphatase YjhB (NUDIX family)